MRSADEKNAERAKNEEGLRIKTFKKWNARLKRVQIHRPRIVSVRLLLHVHGKKQVLTVLDIRLRNLVVRITLRPSRETIAGVGPWNGDHRLQIPEDVLHMIPKRDTVVLIPEDDPSVGAASVIVLLRR